MAAEAARLRDIHPSEVAAVVRALPLTQRRQLAEAMDDERLADVLEELPEAEQIQLVERARPRPPHRRARRDGVRRPRRPARRDGRRAATRILAAMDDEDADVVRRLLSYEEGTAGGMMTPEVIILGPDATVAEALAQIREPDWVVSIASPGVRLPAAVQAADRPVPRLGHVQRLLRESPSIELRHCVSDDPVVAPDVSDLDVAELLASYDMLAVAVCDEAGACSERSPSTTCSTGMLGAGWRQRAAAVAAPGQADGGDGEW